MQRVELVLLCHTVFHHAVGGFAPIGNLHSEIVLIELDYTLSMTVLCCARVDYILLCTGSLTRSLLLLLVSFHLQRLAVGRGDGHSVVELVLRCICRVRGHGCYSHWVCLGGKCAAVVTVAMMVVVVMVMVEDYAGRSGCNVT